VPFEVKCVVETLATESAEVSFNVAVALGVSTQHPLLWERFTTDAAPELVVSRLFSCKQHGKTPSLLSVSISAGYCDYRHHKVTKKKTRPVTKE